MRRLLLSLAIALLCVGPAGCLTRRAIIESSPPGALVLVDGAEIGVTPCAFEYTYYGTREIQLIKDGFETQTVLQKFETPWYQVFPLDAITDNALFTNVTDRRVYRYQMRPQVPRSTGNLLDRADALRTDARIGRP